MDIFAAGVQCFCKIINPESLQIEQGFHEKLYPCLL